MKTLFLLSLILSLTIACGKKVKQKPLAFTVNSLESDTKKYTGLDSDYDGFLDSEEEKNGTQKYIAELPEVELSSEDPTGMDFTFYTNSGHGLKKYKLNFEKKQRPFINSFRAKVSHLAYQELFGTYKKNVPSLSWGDKKELNCLFKKDELISMEKIRNAYDTFQIKNHKLSLFYKTNFKNHKFIKNISDLSFGIYLNDTAMTKLLPERQNYFFVDHDLLMRGKLNEKFSQKMFLDDFSFKSSLKESNNCINYQTKDFKYTAFNKELSYKNVKSASDQNNAHIFLLHKGKLIKQSVANHKFNLNSYLKHIGYIPKYSVSGKIISLNTYENQFQDLRDINFKTAKDLDKRKWFYFTDDSQKLPGELKAGKVYILAHLSVKDILENANERSIEFNGRIKNKLVLENLFPGDKLKLYVNVHKEVNYPPSIEKVIAGYVKFRTLSGYSNYPHNMACIYREGNKTQSHDRLDINASNLKFYPLTLPNSGKKIFPQLIGNQIGDRFLFEFQIKLEDLKMGTIDLNFPESFHRQIEYQRMNSWHDKSSELFCSKNGPQKKSVVQLEIRNANISLEYDIQVERLGIER